MFLPFIYWLLLKDTLQVIFIKIISELFKETSRDWYLSSWQYWYLRNCSTLFSDYQFSHEYGYKYSSMRKSYSKHLLLLDQAYFEASHSSSVNLESLIEHYFLEEMAMEFTFCRFKSEGSHIYYLQINSMF